ncbi:MAG: hypothetical protein ACOH19_00750 [Rhodoglobus sp.]
MPISNIRAGARLYSSVSSAEFIVVKPADVELTCAGAPLGDAPSGIAPDASAVDILALGKRYEDTTSGLLVMCTKAGAGPIEADGRVLSMLTAKPLPSSD